MISVSNSHLDSRNGLNDARVVLSDLLEESRRTVGEDHGIFSETDEDSRDTTLQGLGEGETGLHSDKEGEENDDWGVVAVGVVGRSGVLCVRGDEGGREG
jgi:hypothetical protein